MNPFDKIAEWHAEAVEFRKWMHRHPELGFQEFETQARVVELLKGYGVDQIHTGIAGTGVVGVIEGKLGAGPSIGLRADMDALPIEELNGFAHKSIHPGKMHACGHDGHTTILLMAAKYLAKYRNFAGQAVLIFQPAEESLGGARHMIDDGLLTRFPLSAIFALHNLPGLAESHFAMRPGPVMAGADRFTITVTGKGGHAAFPHQSKDPLLVATSIYQGIQALVSRTFDPLEPVVISVTQIHCGRASNVIEDTAAMNGTFRTFSMATRDQLIQRMETMVPHLAEAFDMRAVLELSEMPYPPTINSSDETRFAAGIAKSMNLPGEVDDNCKPLLGAEDFSFFLEQVPGCYAFLGNGLAGSPFGAGLHNNSYEFNDAIIPTGASYFVNLVENWHLNS